MTNVREPRPDRTGAVAAGGGRRRRPVWLWLLLLLIALALLAWLLYTLLHDSNDDNTAAPGDSATATASPNASPSTAPGTTATSTPSAADTSGPSAVDTALPSTGGSQSEYGAALVGGGGVPALAATGTGAAEASESGTQSDSGSVDPAATGPQGTVLFASDSAALDANAQKVIAAAAVRIAALHPTTVTVTGYTDVVGGQPANSTLSQQRADAVATQLRKALTGTGTEVVATAKGEQNPVAPNSTAAGRQQNRRAAITSSN